VYQDRRWDGAFLTVKKLVNSGALEKSPNMKRASIVSALTRNLAPGASCRTSPLPAFCGTLAHLIDGALVLFGEPESISATALRQRENSQIDDAFDVILPVSETTSHPAARASSRMHPAIICCFTGRRVLS